MHSNPWFFTVVATSLWLSVFAPSRAAAEITPVVAFGNLGTSGSGSLGNTSTTTGTGSTFRLAQGFITGTSVSTSSILSVTLGLATLDGSAGLRTVEIWSNAAGNNPGSLLASSASRNVSGLGLYSFSFNWLELEPQTRYWVVPSNPVLWYYADSDAAPEALNGSDWQYGGTRIQNQSTSVWTSSASRSVSAISIVAVPEPETLMVGLIGLVTCGAINLTRHRRQRRVAETALA